MAAGMRAGVTAFGDDQTPIIQGHWPSAGSATNAEMRVRLPLGVVRNRGVFFLPLRIFQMRFVSLAIAVAALILAGGSVPGAITRRTTPVPAVLPKTTMWRGWVTVYLGGKALAGYADWRGFPDTVPTNDPTTWVFVGSGSSWRLLSAAELRGATVQVVEIDLGYSNGPFKPGTKATGL